MNLSQQYKHAINWWIPQSEQPLVCFCVGPQDGQRECPCALRHRTGQVFPAGKTKPRIRVKAVSVPA